jgi:hypothetical protein
MYGHQDKRFASQKQQNPIDEKTRSERKKSPILVRVNQTAEISYTLPSFEEKNF